MDFKRVERIFIIAFALLNIFLFIGYINRQDIQYVSTDSETIDLLGEMADYGIELPDLSESTLDGKEIYSMQANHHTLIEDALEEMENPVGQMNRDGTYYQSFVSRPIKLEGNLEEGFTDQDMTTIVNFVNSDQVLFGEVYQFSHFDPQTNRFVFFHMVNGLPVADGTSEISLYVSDEGEIYAYEQTYAGPMSAQGTALTLISKQRAIEILFLNNEISENSKIYPPILTYRRNLHLEDLSMYSPVWIVRIDTKKETVYHRVDAVRGNILREPAVTSMEEQVEEEETKETEESNEMDES